jgi:hypothetical protein
VDVNEFPADNFNKIGMQMIREIRLPTKSKLLTLPNLNGK